MHSYDINERLITSVHSANYEATLDCLMNGAKAAIVSNSCGRTAVGTAALVGDAEILELLIKSCEEPELEIFQKRQPLATVEMDVQSTPDGMDSLEWEDEFDADCENNIDTDTAQATSLYYYYAKTFERTGEIIANAMDASDNEVNSKSKQQDPHALDAMAMSPLHYAAACGHLDCVRILLEHNAKVNCFNSNGYTPLHAGVEYVDVIRLLLKYGISTNIKAINTGETPLHLAIRNRCHESIDLLMAHNANVNESDDIDQTPLICSAAHDLEEVAVALVERGARINLQDHAGHTALYFAVIQNNIELAKYLLQHGARRVPANNLMHECARFNMINMAQVLLDHGESYNMRDKDGLTPTHLAIIGRKMEILEFLLSVAKQQILENTYVDRHENELLLAVHYINTVNPFRIITRLLFAYGIASYKTVSAKSSCSPCYVPFCQSPLSRAIMLNKLEIAEFLIKEGIDVSDICREHVINNLRSMLAPDSIEFATFLVYAGFKFPNKPIQCAPNWKPARRKFEREMQKLCSKPLSLQAQSRIVIRKRLIFTYTNAKEMQFKEKYLTTKQASSLGLMIDALDIPITLKQYLNDFPDCPTLMQNQFANAGQQKQQQQQLHETVDAAEVYYDD